MKDANHAWAARVLDMQINPGNGPDLIDPRRNLGIEIKFGLKPDSWTVLDHQIAYNNGRTCYWGLGIYQLNCPVSSIRTTNPEKLETLVTQREFYLVGWGWMNQFPPHLTTGQTEISQWKNTLRYPKLSRMPQIIHTAEVDKGKIHLTEGVPLGLFDF
ncbi:MAG: hypothetical protein KKD18_03565 [Nanoarchaeota archaeon]|nr:hypothetical protein [Nanoarchaeota archaeon]MBU0977468.1 hypothetical protein [Nanoarchaeota archaeon]